MATKIKKGDSVRILPEFQDAGDENFTWVALCDEEDGLVDIAPVNIGLTIIPKYRVESVWVALI